MSFLEFLTTLPFGPFSTFLAGILVFLVAFGIYKFVKDWLPW